MEKREHIIEKLERFERKHKIISFFLIILLTILIVRFFVNVWGPNPIIKGFELHHFYYGLILLIITSIMLLFKKGTFEINLVLVAISLGLIIDEIIFIGTKIRGPLEYNGSFLSIIIILTIVLIITDLIFYSLKTKK